MPSRDSRRDHDLQREIRQHLELEAEEQKAEGLSKEEARRAAAIAFGNVHAIREDARAVWFPVWLQQAGQDLRYTLRVARRTPTFTVGAILVLALGISASTTIFGALKAVVLEPMPFARPEQLVRLAQTNQERGVKSFSVSLPLYRDWQARGTSFSAMAAERAGAITVQGLGDPRHMDAKWITHNMFSLLGLTPALGRAFQKEDDVPGAARVVMLSHGFWRKAFGGDAGVLDRVLTINGRAHTIIGVAPPDTLNTSDLVLLPVVPFTEDRRGYSDLDVYARLKTNVSIDQASSEMASIAARLGREHPEAHAGWGVSVVPLSEAVVGSGTPRVLYLLLGAVGVLLLITCANLSSLFMVRASARTREIAIRAAIGGGRGRILRQLLTESLLLAGAGGLLGVILSFSGMRLWRNLVANDVPRAGEVGVDIWVLAFACVVSAAAGVLAGIAPARQMARLDVIRGLREGSRSVAAGGNRARNALVVGQLALSVVLLAGAGITIRTLSHLNRVDLGFTPAQVLTARLAPRDRPEAFFADLMTRVRAIPDVAMAGAASHVPMGPGNLSLHVFPVGEARIAPTESVQADWRVVTDGYFGAIATPIVSGRDFSARDDDNAPKVIIVNQTLARMVWGERDPVGRQLDLGGGGGTPATVVGLVRDMRHHNPAVAPAPTYYVPAAAGVWGDMTLVIRTGADAATLMPRIRAQVAALDPALPVYDINTMDALMRRKLAPQRLVAGVLTGFGALALLLAVLGIYGVMAYSTRQRSRESAIRLALGATRRNVIWSLVREGGGLVVAGATLGLAAAFPLMRLLGSVLTDVSPGDPVTFAAAVGILAVAALMACYLPAHRTARISPVETLRAD
ncbi:MAG TPA: ABC transporter permease [Vicinamibacterales bacterium]|nr:ABC transporter permease [Vicinamibacterales bacterium]